jgi:hypothetical protein
MGKVDHPRLFARPASQPGGCPEPSGLPGFWDSQTHVEQTARLS